MAEEDRERRTLHLMLAQRRRCTGKEGIKAVAAMVADTEIEVTEADIMITLEVVVVADTVIVVAPETEADTLVVAEEADSKVDLRFPLLQRVAQARFSRIISVSKLTLLVDSRSMFTNLNLLLRNKRVVKTKLREILYLRQSEA